MELETIEFEDAVVDNPTFRESIRDHEAYQDEFDAWVKRLGKECKGIMEGLELQSKHQRELAKLMSEFEFAHPADYAPSYEEETVDDFLLSTASTIRELEDSRSMLIEHLNSGFVDSFHKLRKEFLVQIADAGRSFHRETERYYSQLEKNLGLSVRKKESALEESEKEIAALRGAYLHSALDYAQKRNEFLKTHKMEALERLIGYVHMMKTHHHQAYDRLSTMAGHCAEVMRSLQDERDTYEVERELSLGLMEKIEEDFKSGGQGRVRAESGVSAGVKEGFVYIQRTSKIGIGTTWARYFCQYSRKDKTFRCPDFDAIDPQGIVVEAVEQKYSDATDRRFCFGITSGAQAFTIQALSETDRKEWLSAMGGLEPVKTMRRKVGRKPGEDSHELSPHGVAFIQHVIAVVEKSPDEEGLYRLSGQKTKVQRIFSECIEKDRRLNLAEEDVHAVTGALKHYLRELHEPLLTFKLHDSFIAAVKHEDGETKARTLRALVTSLPPVHAQVLQMLMKHLVLITEHSESNKMKASNLGVVFGPTLLRNMGESVHGIMSVRFQNLVVEELLLNYAFIFEGKELTASAGSKSRPLGMVMGSMKRTSVRRLPRRVDSGPFGFDDPGATVDSPLRRLPSTPKAGPTPSAVGRPPAALPSSVASTPSSMSAQSSSSSVGAARPPPPTHEPPILMQGTYDNMSSMLDDARRLKGTTVRALYNCVGEEANELTFDVNDIITDVQEGEEAGWLEGMLVRSGQRGLFPYNYVVPIPFGESDS